MPLQEILLIIRGMLWTLWELLLTNINNVSYNIESGYCPNTRGNEKSTCQGRLHDGYMDPLNYIKDWASMMSDPFKKIKPLLQMIVYPKMAHS